MPFYDQGYTRKLVIVLWLTHSLTLNRIKHNYIQFSLLDLRTTNKFLKSISPIL